MHKVLSYDPLNRTSTIFESGEGRKFNIYTVEDCSPIIKANRAAQADDERKKKGIKNNWYHFATVPNSVLLQWKEKYGIDYMVKEDLPKIEKLLNSAEYSYLRTATKI